jgi:preprotein translocase subunit SecG
MEFIIKGIHILISVILIFVVLLQSGKGASMGAAFGGSSNALFGATGSNTFMTKLTTFIAVLFIITCLALAYMSSHMATSSLMSDVQSEAPVMPVAPAGMPDAATIPPPTEGGPGAPAGLPPLDAAPSGGESHEGHDHEGHDHDDHEGHNHP